MANGRNKGSKSDSSRDPGRFVAMPVSVLTSRAYVALSHPGRSLLWEIALQYVRDNNGRLLASGKHLAGRGWTSSDTITRAKRELLAAGFVVETVKGSRPNKASWYAVTWHNLDPDAKYDQGAAQLFAEVRRARTSDTALKAKPTREETYARWRSKPAENAPITPSRGVDGTSIAPSHGVEGQRLAPSHGAIGAVFDGPPTPPDGDLLDTPSVNARSGSGSAFGFVFNVNDFTRLAPNASQVH
jgi:hypothetical protein